MTRRSLALALTIASLSIACGSEEEGLECPATGAVLLANVPELQPEWGPGCIDSSSWTASVEPANATWTVELRRDQSGAAVQVQRLLDGVAVTWGNELILVDSEGRELTSRGLGTNPDWSSFVTTEDGRMIVSGQSGGVPQYRVLAATGTEIWLRLLNIDNSFFGQPGLALADDGTLWLAAVQFTADFENIQVAVQQWAVTGGMLSEVTLPGVSSQQFARDGAGRFVVLDQRPELFTAEGAPIGGVDIGDGFVTQVVGLADGFVLSGLYNDLPLIMKVDGQGQVVWQRTLNSHYTEDYYFSYAAGLAALPDGGVVAVGSEGTIDVYWPDSPITNYEQPFVVALDADGEITWGERLAAGGRAWSVAVGSQGEVYVGGSAQGSKPSEYGGSDQIGWLRRYDP